MFLACSSIVLYSYVLAFLVGCVAGRIDAGETVPREYRESAEEMPRGSRGNAEGMPRDCRGRGNAERMPKESRENAREC